MRVMIDTNVLLDALANREPYVAASSAILLAAAKGEIDLLISASAITDLYYLVRKHLRDSDEARDVLRDVMDLIDIVQVGKVECHQALELPMTDFEDALLVCCAKNSGAEYIITRNLKDFKNSPVEAIEPALFLAKFFAKE